MGSQNDHGRASVVLQLLRHHDGRSAHGRPLTHGGDPQAIGEARVRLALVQFAQEAPLDQIEAVLVIVGRPSSASAS